MQQKPSSGEVAFHVFAFAFVIAPIYDAGHYLEAADLPVRFEVFQRTFPIASPISRDDVCFTLFVACLSLFGGIGVIAPKRRRRGRRRKKRPPMIAPHFHITDDAPDDTGGDQTSHLTATVWTCPAVIVAVEICTDAVLAKCVTALLEHHRVLENVMTNRADAAVTRLGGE